MTPPITLQPDTVAAPALPAPKVFAPRDARPAPSHAIGAVAWIRKNLFSSVPNALMTLLGIWIVYLVLGSFFEWAVFNAIWDAPNRRACLDKVGNGGACWPGVIAWIPNIIYGLYPKDQVWRINSAFLMLVIWLVRWVLE